MDQADHANQSNSSNTPSPSAFYEIRVWGQLDRGWSDWFNGLAVTPQENGETLISGLVQNQAELFGILTKVFHLRLPILSVRRLPPIN